MVGTRRIVLCGEAEGPGLIQNGEESFSEGCWGNT